MFKLLKVIIFVLLLINNSSFSQPLEDLSLVGERFFHATYAYQSLATNEEFLFITNNYGIEVWNFEDPWEMDLISTMPLTPYIGGKGRVQKTIVQDDLLIVGSQENLILIDVSDFREPVVCSTLPGRVFEWINPVFETSVYYKTDFSEFILIDQTVIAMTQGKQLVCVDVSDPANPQYTDEIVLDEDQAFANGQLLEYDGDVLATGKQLWRVENNEDESGLILYEVEDGRLNEISEAYYHSDVNDIGGFSGDAIVCDNLLLYTEIAIPYLSALDISDPSEPEPLDAFDINIRGDQSGGPWLQRDDRRLYVYAGMYIEVFDIEDGIEDLTSLGFFTFDEEEPFTPDRTVYDVLPMDDFLYTISADIALRVLDISDPEDPNEIFSSYDDPLAADFRPVAQNIGIYGDAIYCGGMGSTINGRGLPTVVSIADPTDPVSVGDELLLTDFSYVFTVPEIERLCVLYRNFNHNMLPYLAIFDISQPLRPDFLDQFLTSSIWTNLVTVRDTIGYFQELTGSGMLGVFNLSNPIEVDTLFYGRPPDLPMDYQNQVEIFSVTIDGDQLWLTSKGHQDNPELRRYDMTPIVDREYPEEIELVQSVDLQSLDLDSADVVYSVVFDEDNAYMVTGQTYFREGRLIYPFHKKLIVADRDIEEIISITGLPYEGKLTINNGRLYLTNPDNGLRVYDIDNPAEPLPLLDEFDTPGIATQLIFKDTLVVVADIWSLLLLGSERENAGPSDIGSLIPTEIELKAAYPNPFNSSTRLTYTVPQPGVVTLKLFDIAGREVELLRSGIHEAGSFSHSLNSNTLSAGIYILSLQSGNSVQNRKIVCMK